MKPYNSVKKFLLVVIGIKSTVIVYIRIWINGNLHCLTLLNTFRHLMDRVSFVIYNNNNNNINILLTEVFVSGSNLPKTLRLIDSVSLSSVHLIHIQVSKIYTTHLCHYYLRNLCLLLVWSIGTLSSFLSSST